MTTAFELRELSLSRTDGSNGKTDLVSSGDRDAGGLVHEEQGEPMQNQPNFSKVIHYDRAMWRISIKGIDCADDNRCGILVVGSTGSGKSSTIARVTGQLVRAGDTHQSVTRTSNTYTVRRRWVVPNGEKNMPCARLNFNFNSPVSWIPYVFPRQSARTIWVPCTLSTPSAGKTRMPTISTLSSRCSAPLTDTT